MAVKKPAKSHNPDSDYCVYLGPSVLGALQTGTIYRGTKADVLKTLAPAMERYPLAASLIVTGDALPVARIKVKTPGNLLYVNYRKMLAGGK